MVCISGKACFLLLSVIAICLVRFKFVKNYNPRADSGLCVGTKQQSSYECLLVCLWFQGSWVQGQFSYGPKTSRMPFLVMLICSKIRVGLARLCVHRDDGVADGRAIRTRASSHTTPRGHASRQHHAIHHRVRARVRVRESAFVRWW